ncbi:MAG: O-antigen ligase family protein [Terriglobales bacterium]|jgi:O-antigen ligase
MNSLKPLQWAGIGLGVSLALYFIYHHLHYFSDVSFLGGILLLEVIIASLWKYDERFFALLMITFVWAGMYVPLQGAWTAGRWVVLSAGAVVGFIVWTKNPRRSFRSLHLIAFFCICAALASATVSPYMQMAFLKALSLLLLFLYCAAGARLAVLGREDRFFHGLLWGSEIAVYVTVICYFGLGRTIWGNPNSLGAVMGVGLFPILFWGWLVSNGRVVRLRRLVALLLCTYLVYFSVTRSGMASVALVTLVFCVCLHQYKLLVRIVALVLFLVAVVGMLAPGTLNKRFGDLKDTLLYKGHKDEGVLGSRRTPWQKSIATIKEHPLFGTGYGTSPTGEDPGLDFGTIASSAATAREHGSSYMTIAEWVGLLGVLPFAALVVVTASNVWKVCAWMIRTADPRHYSIPLAMVVLAGLVHATFEDWLFAPGYYLCVFFWVFAFLLADLVPGAVVVPVDGVVSRAYRRPPAGFAAVVPNR